MRFLKFINWFLIDQFTFYFGGSDPAPPTNTTVQNSNLPEYVQPYVESMLGAAQKQVYNFNPNGSISGFKGYTPYSTNMNNYVAGFSPMQQASFTNAQGLQTPGQFNQASQMLGQAGLGSLQTAGQLSQAGENYSALPSTYLSSQAPNLQSYQMQGPRDVQGASAQAAQLGIVPLAQAAGFQGPSNVSAQNVNAQNVSSQNVNAPNLQNYQMQGPSNVSAQNVNAPTMQGAQTNFNPNLTQYQMGPASQVSTQSFNQPGTAQSYMNPYLSASLSPQLDEIRRQYGINQTNQMSNATKQGAFGGSREALMAAENQRNMNTGMNQAITQGYNTAFNNAQQQFNTQQQASLAAQQANQSAGLQTGAQNLNAALGVQQLGTQSGLQAQLANLSNQQQAAVNNQATQFQANGMNAQQALQAALANQQAQQSTQQQNLAANLGVQQLGAGQNLQAQQLNQQSGLQAGLANQQAGMQAQQLNQQAGLQAGLANQQMGYNTGLQNAQMQQQANLANQGILGQYGMQQGTMNQQTNLANQQTAQQAALANQQMGYNTNAQNLAAQLGIQQLGSGQNLQSQLANQGAYGQAQQLAANQQQFGANLGLQGLQGALTGYNQLGQAAGALGNLGTSQLAAQQGIIGMQNAYGAQQQAAEQQKINQAIQNYATAQQYPMMQLGNMSNLLRGLPMQSTTTQSYQAQPSTLNTLAGLGTGIAGAASLLRAKGGTVKSYAGGGVTSLENRQRIAENYNPQQIQQSVQRGVLPQGIGSVLSQDYANMSARAQQSQAAQAMAQQAAQPNPGVTGLPSNLPVATAAQGGIIAFDGGGEVERFASKGAVVAKDPLHWDYVASAPDYTQADAMITAAKEAPHTIEDIAKAREIQEGKRGIKDTYASMLEDLKAKEAKLSSKQDRAQGLALLQASGAIFKNAHKPGLEGIGAGIESGVASYAPAVEKLDALKENYNQQNNNIMLAQNAYKEAALNNDTTRMDKAKANIISAQQNRQKLEEDYAKTVDTGNLKKAEKTADYYKDVSVEGMKANNQKLTDMRNGIDIIYNSLTQPGPNGEPPKMAAGPQAKAFALKQYQEQSGMSLEKLLLAKELGAGKLNAAQMRNFNDAKAKDPEFQLLKTKMAVMKPDNPNYAAVKQQIDDLELKHLQGAMGGNAGASEVTPAPEAKPAPVAKPVPADKSAMVKGTLYNTVQGPAVWDGKQFVAQ